MISLLPRFMILCDDSLGVLFPFPCSHLGFLYSGYLTAAPRGCPLGHRVDRYHYIPSFSVIDDYTLCLPAHVLFLLLTLSFCSYVRFCYYGRSNLGSQPRTRTLFVGHIVHITLVPVIPYHRLLLTHIFSVLSSISASPVSHRTYDLTQSILLRQANH